MTRLAGGQGETAPDSEPLVPEFQHVVEFFTLGRRGAERAIAATEAECSAIARYLDLIALDALSATIDVRPWRKGYIVTGSLRARVAQACVVTLEPVVTDIVQDFERRYLPADQLAREVDAGAKPGEIDFDVTEGEVPEVLPARGLPLGNVVVEELSLALDPFPRAPGAALADAAEQDEALHPFAALAQLRRGD